MKLATRMAFLAAGLGALAGCGLMHPGADAARQALVEALGSKLSVQDFEKTGNASWEQVGVFGNGTDWVSYQAHVRVETSYRDWYRSQGRSLSPAEATAQEAMVNRLLGGKEMAWAQARVGQEFDVEGRIEFEKSAQGWRGMPD